MTNLLLDPAVYPLLTFHCLIGGIAALVAKQKGYNFWLWLILGIIGGTFAFMGIILMNNKEQEPDATK
jgi:4-amino-4-deoxy-L-arabinose transferase-like glycosyltransferase